MPIYTINGISVDFPYDAYDSQIDYMDKVIQALQGRSNALLESPTGTGKTLCLLCATLGYRASLGPFSTGTNNSSEVRASQSQTGSLLPKIIYTSRTHSQLRQVIQELKKTNYRPKMMVLGSREQLCIHDKVKLLRGRAQTNACQYLRKRSNKRFCGHFKLTAEFLKSNSNIGDEPVDIEDLVNIGKSCGPCPYYVSRELLKNVDILFAPYNYLIDRSFKDRLGIELNSSILIFDEAHNLEGICADAASFDLPAALLSACISEAKNCIDLSIKRRDIDKSAEQSCNPDSFAILRALLLKLEKKIADVPIVSNEFGFTRPGPYIYELLEELNLTSETASKLTGIVEEAVLLLEEDRNGSSSKESNVTSCKLETIGDILKLVFRDGGTSHAKYYRVHVQERLASDYEVLKGKGSKARTLSWWCFNPGLCLEDFSKKGVGSVILTSGTLSPLDSFAYELKLDFPIRLENPHVISSNQIWSGVVSEGPSGYSFNSSYRNRDVVEYKQELGNAIVNFARIVPDGLLVFFPSYYVMEQCISCWKENSHRIAASQLTIWERISKFKQPVIEPRQSSLFSSSIEDFNSKLNDRSTSGAVFFAVCRGKVSEGLDFADHYGRAVVITGLPFATRTDPKVRLKREFLDENVRSKSTSHKPLTGEEWYDQQASRAVNQAVGRVIRHRHDYGAIIFCDERFATSHRQAQVSRWIQPHVKCYSKFGDVVYSLTRFFRVEIPRLVKVEPLVQIEPLETASDAGIACQKKDTQPFNACCSMKKVNGLALDDDCCIVPPPIGVKVEKFDDVNLFRKILPANRSSLAVQNELHAVSMKHTGLSLGKQKVLPTRAAYGHKASDLVDLTDDASQSPDDKLIVHCSSKRQKTLKIEPGFTESKRDLFETPGMIKALSKCSSAAGASTVTEKTYNSLNKRRECSEIGGSMASQERGTNSANQDTHSVSTKDEKKAHGHNFLSQVKQILDKSEYKEFLGYLDALKSRALTIGSVLQSIVKLFSTLDRRPLLRRFKHYIPEKYHSMYEECCTSIGGTSEP